MCGDRLHPASGRIEPKGVVSMPFYETVFIARQDIAANQVETLANSFADIIRAKGGKVGKTEQWGLRTLTFRINKNRKGHYVLMNIDATPDAVQEMERNMRLSEDILRYMSIKVEALEEGPSAMLRREERTDRGYGERGERPAGGDRPRRAPRVEATAEEGA